MSKRGDALADLLETPTSEPLGAALSSLLLRCNIVISGHFALHRQRHAMKAFRFRGIGRDPEGAGCGGQRAPRSPGRTGGGGRRGACWRASFTPMIASSW